MKIYAMTATFGKLEYKTLTLEPGFNVIQAPNEWGKSTWCAFLTAILYGLDTRTHSTKTTLSDKERYSPWSGAPMSGRIDLNWNGRDITIERRTKGRTIFGEFRAYETDSGLPVPELTAQNCGQQLLKAEKSVFTRSAMIRQADLPVTQDEALRHRLNALVTTGDDSGAAEELERRLRDLKNRCRYNRTGLLPQAESEAAALDHKLRELDQLESRSQKLRQQAAALEDTIEKLNNHRAALVWTTAQENARLRQQADAELEQAEQAYKALEAQCTELPPQPQAMQTYGALRSLQDRWAQLRMDSTPPLPTHPVFRDLTPEEARQQTADDARRYARLRKPLLWLLIPALLAICAGVALITPFPEHTIWGYCAIGIGGLALLCWAIAVAVRFRSARSIADRYGNRNISAWIATAEDYVNHCRSHQQSEAQRQAAIAALRQETTQLCQGQALSDALRYWQDVCRRWDALKQARDNAKRHQDRCALLRSLPIDASAPRFPDSITLSDTQTRASLSEASRQLRETQLRLGQCQGQMEAIGHRRELEGRREEIRQRINRLEETYSALELAISTLETARSSLQQRFAPRITARAQDILIRLTGGRYSRLVLDSNLTIQANAAGEHTLRSALWRSDGTADLLYLALRLAVAQELIPDAPLILDDALIRFDDTRLAQAMSVLKDEAAHRQILIFTCHSRERNHI